MTYMMNQARERGAGDHRGNRSRPRTPGSPRSATGCQLGARFYTECTPGYYNNEGKLGNPIGFFAGTYVEGPLRFVALIDEFREGDRLPGVTLR